MRTVAGALLVLLCWQSAAWAADLVVPIQQGQPAPANGYWLSEDAYKEALEQSAWFRKLLERRELELASLREQMQVRLASQQEQAKIERDALEAKLKLEIDELKKREATKDLRIVELERGKPRGKAREKFARVHEMLEALNEKNL